MSLYLTLKWAHILSSTILFGTGLGTAFYLFVINRTGDRRAIAAVLPWIVKADWWFTTPTVILQPATGFALILLAGYDWQQSWILYSIILYLVAGACWLPVVYLQLKMHDEALYAEANDQALSPAYWRRERLWVLLGIPAFLALVVVFWLMVHKPV